MLSDWNYIKYENVLYPFFCYCFYKLCRTAEQLDLFSRVSVDHTAQSRGTGSEAWVSQVSDNSVTWTVLLFFFSFWALLTSEPQQHALWSTAAWRNAQRQGSALSCWGTKALLKADVRWHSVRLGTESHFILRVLSVNVIQLLALTVLYTQTQEPFSHLLLLFQSYCRVLSSSLTKRWWL